METEFDFKVEEITEHMFRRYLLETREGVYVDFVEVGSAGDKADLLAGDVIIMVDDKKIKNLDDFKKAMAEVGKPAASSVTWKRTCLCAVRFHRQR